MTRVLPAILACALPVSAQHAKNLLPKHADEVQAMQPRINEAIDKGVEWLLQQQRRDGSWDNHRHTFPTGQTALSVYTLLKSGVPRTHAAIQRGIANMKSQKAEMVYSVGCQLLALGATHDPAHREHIAELLDDLERWQDGSWSYPNPGIHDHLHQDRDLSITQFAVLGFRAAMHAGVKLSQKAVKEAFEDILKYQSSPRPSKKGRSMAGFRYHWSARAGETGSMTTAGIAAAQIAAECLGKKLGRARRKQLERATELGLEWLDDNYMLESNPGKGNDWRYYYMYGIERAGSLLGIEYIGDHPWYLDGAKLLLKDQHKDGHWSQNDAQADTCFALLFLQRATAPTTGDKSRASKMSLKDDPKSEVGVEGTGGVDGEPLRMWITRIGKIAATSKEASSIRVDRVIYRVDGNVVADVDADPLRPWNGDSHYTQHAFPKRGTYTISVAVHTANVSADGEVSQAAVFESKPITFQADHMLENWMLDAAVAHERNRLPRNRTKVTTSSARKDHPGKLAIDGEDPTSWLFEPADTTPTISLKLKSGKRATHLVLVQANGMRGAIGHYDRIERVAVVIGRNDPVEYDLNPDELAPTVLALPPRTHVKSLEIRVVKRAPGKRHRGIGGFAEIGLELRGK